jgi:hypothetical protein
MSPNTPTQSDVYNETAYACGNCGYSDSSASQYRYKFWAPPANYADGTKTTPTGNPFIKPYANISIYYPETSTASGLTSNFRLKGGFSFI